MKQKVNLKIPQVVFRRWDNKRYAVFNSLRKVIKIASLSVAYLLFANQGVVQAQETDSSEVARNYDLESIDVTVDALPESYSALSRVVVTIDRKEIERAAASSIDELLEYASNIDLRQRGINGMQSDISIRGGSFDQVLILLNGTNITDPQTGHHNLNLPFSLSSIERIEILKGPGAWKFGPGAFSGAINIITKTPEAPFIKLALEGGQYRYHDEQLSAALPIGKTSHLLTAQNSASDGYTQNTDYRSKNIYYRGMLESGVHTAGIQAAVTDKKFGANSFYTARFPDQYEETRTWFASADYQTKWQHLQLNPGVYFRRNNDRFLLFRENPELYGNYHTTDVWGGNVLANYLHGSNAITTVGLAIRNESIFSNNLGEESKDPRFSPVNDTILLDKSHQRSNYSVFAGHKQYFNQLMINVGINLSYNSDLKGRWFVYPGIDAAYQLSESSTLTASVNRTMRMPTYTDLYYHGPNNQGNPDLLPEEASGFDLGYRFQLPGLKVAVSGFHTRGNNMIDWVREDVDAIWRTVNYTRLLTSGIETSLNANFEKLIHPDHFLQQLNISYTFIEQSKPETTLLSNYALNYLRHRVDINFSHRIFSKLSAKWLLVFQDRNGQFERIEDGVSLGMSNYDPFFTSTLKIEWRQPDWHIYAMLNNLFDVQYFDYGNVPQPGRWIKFGFAKKIDFDQNRFRGK
ncbi:TonB-dependent receptor plug domain-containing protein [Roseimarinus sediminis]|uniref:TonB-dependent receptor plug domain-containing protein n=1 Tax=Roseimarinus sediminis TaxID=1610899 RepID=UPI003D1FC9E2